MPSLWVIKSVGMIIISFMIGVLFFYFTSPLNVKEKKKQLEDVISLLINLVIYIWVGKILLHISLFLDDPLAVLAYPSNADSLYIAILLFIINLGYRRWKTSFSVMNWLESFLPVIIAAAFSYEFLQLMDNGAHQLNQLIFMMAVLLAYILLENKLSLASVTLYTVTLWMVGEIALSFLYPHVTLFGYLMKPLFNVILAIGTIGFLFYSQRKQV